MISIIHHLGNKEGKASSLIGVNSIYFLSVILVLFISCDRKYI